MNTAILLLILSALPFLIASQTYGEEGDMGVAFVGDINNTAAGDLVTKAVNGDKWDWSTNGDTPSHVIIVGDACYHSDYVNNTCIQLSKYQAKFGDKLKVICGNHDLSPYVQKICSKPFAFEVYDTLIIGLNTQRIANDEQFNFVQRAIWNSSASQIVIVTHEPCIPSHSNKIPIGLYELCDKLRDLELPMEFVAAHHHVMMHVKDKGIDYYTVGSGGGELQECNPKKATYDFCLSQYGYLLMGWEHFTFGGLEDDSLFVVKRK